MFFWFYRSFFARFTSKFAEVQFYDLLKFEKAKRNNVTNKNKGCAQMCKTLLFAQKIQQILNNYKKYCFTRSLNVIVDILEHCLTTSKLNLAINFTGIIFFLPKGLKTQEFGSLLLAVVEELQGQTHGKDGICFGDGWLIWRDISG
jgi:hypothetical protein